MIMSLGSVEDLLSFFSPFVERKRLILTRVICTVHAAFVIMVKTACLVEVYLDDTSMILSSPTSQKIIKWLSIK